MYIWGILGTTGINLLFFGISRLNYSEANVIVFSSPIWSGILGHLFMHEKFRCLEIFSTLLGLLGTILIFKPPFLLAFFGYEQDMLADPESAFVGRIICLFSALNIALVVLVLRNFKGDQQVSPFVTIVYFNVSIVLVNPILMIFVGYKSPNLFEYCIIFLQSLLSFGG